nr:MAG TPA: hypothetical protein [Caudoviricetes sp.]
MDTGKLIYKLQSALKQKKVYVTINTYQFYSDEKDRYIKMYIVKRGKNKLIETPSQIQVITTLNDIWQEVKDD